MLDNSNILGWSYVDNGLYCLPCFVFLKEGGIGRGKHEQAGQFVKQAYRRYKDFLEDFNKHKQSDYHKTSVQYMESFVHSMQKGETVQTILVDSYSKIVKENRLRLRIILKAIITCACQEIALRGHRDAGPIEDIESIPEINEGHLRDLIKALAQMNTEAKRVIEDSAKNATYLSPQIQNSLIDLVAQHLLDKRLTRIRQTNCISVMADETGRFHRDFLNIILRYCCDGTIYEDFMGLIKVEEKTGEALSALILNKLLELEIDLAKIVGLGFDGASNFRF